MIKFKFALTLTLITFDACVLPVLLKIHIHLNVYELDDPLETFVLLKE
jgi:hypothetical protein